MPTYLKFKYSRSSHRVKKVGINCKLLQEGFLPVPIPCDSWEHREVRLSLGQIEHSSSFSTQTGSWLCETNRCLKPTTVTYSVQTKVREWFIYFQLRRLKLTRWPAKMTLHKLKFTPIFDKVRTQFSPKSQRNNNRLKPKWCSSLWSSIKWL